MPDVIDEMFESGAGPTRLRIVGHGGARRPLVLVHGGPGLTWDYLEEFDALAAAGIPVIHYDQLGSGGSSATPAAEVTLGRLLEQLDGVVDKAVGDRPYDLLMHSSGSVVGFEHALARPTGLTRLVVANGFAASSHAVASIARHCRDLPAAQRAAIAASDFDSPDYASAVGTFYGRHVFRTPPSNGLQRALGSFAENPGVSQRLWGPDIFHLAGLYADWNVVERLSELDLPTLVYRGEHDETGVECMEPMLAGLPRVEGAVIAEASHVPHMEQREITLSLVRDFLCRD